MDGVWTYWSEGSSIAMTLVFDQSTVPDVETRDAYEFTYSWPKD